MFHMAATRPEIPASVLVADDQPDVLEALRWLLTGEYPRYDLRAGGPRADPPGARA
jgi:hypothetical protein